jgi:uncharacterized protein
MEDRKDLDAADKASMDSSEFAYVDSSGDKHFPINDEEHVQKAAQLFGTFEGWGSDEDKVAAAHKIVAAAKKFGVGIDEESPVGKAAGVTNDIQHNSDEPQPGRKPRQRRELDGQPEVRLFTLPNGGEVRASKNADTGNVTLEGQVIVYGVPYQVNDMWGSFTETIHRGSCSDLLQSPDLDIRFLFNHGGMPLARTGAGLEVTESDSGLNVRAELDPRMSLANDLIVAIERGLITQMSVGMEVDRSEDSDQWSGEDEYGIPNVRNIFKLRNVFDTSAVTYPASTTTSIGIARAAWDRLAPDSRERLRQLWEIAREVRAGRDITQAEAESLMRLLEVLHGADERSERAAPTKQDAKVSAKVAGIHKAIQDAFDAQAKDSDPDDPDDQHVTAALHAIKAAADKATVAQAKDSSADPGDTGPEENSDGTTGGSSSSSGIGNADGTGPAPGRSARARRADVDADRLRLNRTRL